MSEVSDVVIKRTQDLLGKIIKKPALTDKLLRKPPFKFLHDIIHGVITTTGFLDGLYTNEELQSENIKDRDEKIAFLQKTIDALKLATNQEVKARPSKIVAGLEADKTNELLIAIAKAIDRKVDTTEAVSLIKSGQLNGTQKKEPKKPSTKTEKGKTDAKDATVKKKTKAITDNNQTKKPAKDAKVTKQTSKDSTDAKKQKLTATTKDKEKKKERDKKPTEKRETEKRDSSGRKEKPDAKPDAIEQHVEIAQTNGEVPILTNELRSDAIENGEEKPKLAQVESAEVNGIQNEQPKSAKEAERNEVKPVKQKSAEKIAEKPTEERNENGKQEEPTRVAAEKVAPVNTAHDVPQAEAEILQNEVQEPAVNDKPRSSKRRSHSRTNGERNGENKKAEEKSLTTSKSVDKLIERPLGTAKRSDGTKSTKPPRTALRSAAVRPISARPSAPRRRDRNVRQILHTESFVQESSDNKLDKKNSMPEFDDADNIVITDIIPDNISAINEPMPVNIDGQIDGEQGHLVQQILKTQTAILKTDTKNEIPDESILSDRKSITRNMTELRKVMQKLSLYITPLGKMMEYFQEDVDAMQIELAMWQKAGAAAEADIKDEQRTTEKLLENYKYQLAEINNGIKEHAEQINNTTMNIIQNEEKISKMITTITNSSDTSSF